MSEKGPKGDLPSFEEWSRQKQEEEERERRKPVRRRRAKRNANAKAESVIARAQARRRKDPKDALSSEEIVFGQAFYPYNDKRQPLHVVTDTSPRYYPESIGVQQVIIEETKGGTIERLGLSGDIAPSKVGQVVDVWTLERIIKAHAATFDGKLPDGVEEVLRENSSKAPRKIA